MGIEDVLGTSLEEALLYRTDRDKLARRIAEEMIRYYSLMLEALSSGGLDLLERVRDTWDSAYHGVELFVDDEYGVDYIALMVANNEAEKYLSKKKKRIGYRER